MFFFFFFFEIISIGSLCWSFISFGALRAKRCFSLCRTWEFGGHLWVKKKKKKKKKKNWAKIIFFKSTLRLNLTNLKVDNMYVKSTNLSTNSDMGGIFGTVELSNNSLTIKDSYSSAKLYAETNNTIGIVIGRIYSEFYNLSFSNVFYDEDVNSNLTSSPYSGDSFPSDIFNMVGYNCSFLYVHVNNSFNHSFWGGNNLLSQYSIIFLFYFILFYFIFYYFLLFFIFHFLFFIFYFLFLLLIIFFVFIRLYFWWMWLYRWLSRLCRCE